MIRVDWSKAWLRRDWVPDWLWNWTARHKIPWLEFRFKTIAHLPGLHWCLSRRATAEEVERLRNPKWKIERLGEHLTISREDHADR